jgi:CsgH protein
MTALRVAPLVLASLALPGGLVAPARSEPPVTDVKCQIRATPATGLLRLEAVARSERSLAGAYRLSVMKQSPSGMSQNVQSGRFRLAPGRERVLTTVILDRSAEGHYTAKLLLEWDQGSVSCSSP